MTQNSAKTKSRSTKTKTAATKKSPAKKRSVSAKVSAAQTPATDHAANDLKSESIAALLARREAAVPRGVASAAPIFASYAENAELWDVEGKRYIDFAGGIAVLNTGHRHPGVVAAAKAQEDLYTHTSFQVVPYEPYVALAYKLPQEVPAGDHGC